MSRPVQLFASRKRSLNKLILPIACLAALLAWHRQMLPCLVNYGVQQHWHFRKGRHVCVRRAASAEAQERRACVTEFGQDLEQELLRTHAIAERQFDQSLRRCVDRREGVVPGLRGLLESLKLSKHCSDAIRWADEMGASELDEVAENVDVLAEELGLQDEALEQLKEGVVSAVASLPAGDSKPQLTADEMEDLLSNMLFRPPVPEAFHAVDLRLSQAKQTLASQGDAARSDTLEGALALQLRERLHSDVLYLSVMREIWSRHLLVLPSFVSSDDKTWAFSAGDGQYMEMAGKHAFGVPLPPLSEPTTAAMRRVVLGGSEACAQLLDAYVKRELAVVYKTAYTDSELGQLAKALKMRVTKSMESIAGASGLPDRNRTTAESPVGFALTKEAVADREEAAKQLFMLNEVIANTRVGQADVYFGHLLFGFLFQRLLQRFQLADAAGSIVVDDAEEFRARLERQAGDISSRKAREQATARRFDIFVADLLKDEGAIDRLLELSPLQLRAVRRHTDYVFGEGLREEIFHPFSRASRASAAKGEIAAGPALCAEFVLEAAKQGEVRMLSLGPQASERMMWSGLLWGSVLQKVIFAEV